MNNDNEFKQIIRNIKNNFVKNTKNRENLGKVIEKYLVPLELHKKKLGEITTLADCRKEMLKTLGSIEGFQWSLDCKYFEPCVGKGGFLVDILDILMEVGKDLFPNEELREKHIIENCLWFADINPTNIFICKMLIDPDNKYKLNYHEGDSLELDITKTTDTWQGVENFYAAITNPPYATDPSKQNTTPQYNLHTEKYIDKCDYLLLVIPSRWFIGGKGLGKFRKFMMNRKDLQLIRHEDNAKKWFGNGVEIKGGVNYFIKNKYYTGPCLFNGTKYSLNKYDIIIKPKYHKIIDKLSVYPSIEGIYITSGYFKYRTNDKRLKKEGKIKCYVSYLKSKNRCKYIDEYIFNEDNSFWKIVTSRAAHGAYSGFGFKTIASPNEIYTDSYISFRVKTKNEAHSLLSYLNTKLVNYMLSARKISQDISKKTCMWIPIVPFDRPWDDDEVYKYFNLTQNEIKHIEENGIC